MSRAIYTRTQNNRTTNSGISRPSDLENSSQSNQNAQTDQRYEHRGAYAVIAPDENRRQRVLNVANKETRDFEEYKKRNAPRYNIHSTVGELILRSDQACRITDIRMIENESGESVPASSSRLVNSTATPASQRLAQQEKRRAYQTSIKERENLQIQTKLHAARQQANRNEETMLERKTRLDEDRRVKNDAFLRRLEDESKKKSHGKS